ncbi:hypothetical protein ACHHYP_14536 [Achlya hypogyna]|uniref:Secreted protein n=1 Tax=Achlya hypogyna TaxID=1202772 RepID=A0A0A7CPJ7_ACHHY|nr:secreted protein [Achlya hypogyna]OQR83577.1 hypothetical protein ACHHYP_14536 [Achlya hypogyna]
MLSTIQSLAIASALLASSATAWEDFVAGLREIPDGNNRCTGALIAPRLVLTSASCLVQQVSPRIYDTAPVEYVSLGSANINGTATGERIAVVENILHPDFSFDALNWSTTNDFGLLVLKTPSSYTPVPVDFAPIDEGSLAALLGWQEVLTSPNPTAQVEGMMLASDDVCASAYSAFNATSNLCLQTLTTPTSIGRDNGYGRPVTVTKDGKQELVAVDSFSLQFSGGVEVTARLSGAQSFLEPYLNNATLVGNDGLLH